jgi:signal peptidase I
MTLTVVDVPVPRKPSVHLLPLVVEPLVVEPLVVEPEQLPLGAGAPARSCRGPRHARPARLRPRREPQQRRWVDHVLTLGALLGIVMTAVTIGATTTGLRPLVVRSGSMEPTIHTGAMVLVRTVPASDIRVGDVVAVERPDHTRVTHRVMSVEHHGATAALVLKGDANEDPDPAIVVVTSAGRFVATAPLLGRVGAFLSSAKGGFVLGWLVAMAMLAVLRRAP